MVGLRIIASAAYSSDSTVHHIFKISYGLLLSINSLVDLRNNEMCSVSTSVISNQVLGGWTFLVA